MQFLYYVYDTLLSISNKSGHVMLPHNLFTIKIHFGPSVKLSYTRYNMSDRVYFNLYSSEFENINWSCFEFGKSRGSQKYTVRWKYAIL